MNERRLQTAFTIEEQQPWTESPNPAVAVNSLTRLPFHVLLNSLSKVLFNFTPRYSSTIGLVPIFSLGWSLPSDLGCVPKQPDPRIKGRRSPSALNGPGTHLKIDTTRTSKYVHTQPFYHGQDATPDQVPAESNLFSFSFHSSRLVASPRLGNRICTTINP